MAITSALAGVSPSSYPTTSSAPTPTLAANQSSTANQPYTSTLRQPKPTVNSPSRPASSFNDLDLDGFDDGMDDEDVYGYDYAHGVPEVDRRDRRIQRWLEQQCRFSLVFGESGAPISRGKIPVRDAQRELIEGGGTREEDEDEEDDEEQAMDLSPERGKPAPVSISLRHQRSARTLHTNTTPAATTATRTSCGSSQMFVGAATSPDARADATTEERADSPLLGFPSTENLLLPSPEAGLSGNTSDDGAADAALGGTANPLTRPAKNWVRDLPLDDGLANVNESRFAVRVHDEDMHVHVDVKVDVQEDEEAEEQVLVVSRDKPLPTLPPPSTSTSPVLAASIPADIAADASPSTPLTVPTDITTQPSDSPVSPTRQHVQHTPAIQASPLPASSAPTRRQSRAAFIGMSMTPVVGGVDHTSGSGTGHMHAQNVSVTSLGSAGDGANTGNPGASTSNVRSRSGSVGLRHAVYINSEEVIERLDALLLRDLAEVQRDMTLEEDGGLLLGSEREDQSESSEGREEAEEVLGELGLGLRGLEEGREDIFVHEFTALDTLLEQDVDSDTPPPSVFSTGGFVVTTSPMTATRSSSASHSPIRRQTSFSAALPPLHDRQHTRDTSASSSRRTSPTSSRPALSRSQSQSFSHTHPDAYTNVYAHSHSHSHPQSAFSVASRSGSREMIASASMSGPASPALQSRSTSTMSFQQSTHHAHHSSHVSHHSYASQSSHASLINNTHSHSRSSSVLLSTPLTPLMHIAIPVALSRTGAVRPTRPPPAPPLDLGLASEGHGLGLGLMAGEEGVFYGDVLASEDGSHEGYLTLGTRGHAHVADESLMVDTEKEKERGYADHIGVRDEEEGRMRGSPLEEEEEHDEHDPEQFLRVLHLGDRMQEFGVKFPSSFQREDERQVEPYGVLEEAAHVREDDGVLRQGLRGEPEKPRMERSVSRWSLTSSTMDQPIRVQEKKKKSRKSFISPFTSSPSAQTTEQPSTPGEADGAVDGNSLSTPITTPSSKVTATTPTTGEKKKRGRLASFISRLSGVGAGGTFGPPNLASSGPGTPSSPPPVPTIPAGTITVSPGPASYNFGFTMGAGFGGLELSDIIPPVSPVPAGALLPSPLIVDAPMKKLKAKQSKELLKAEKEKAEKNAEEKDLDVSIELAGSVHGVWDKQRDSFSNGIPAPVSPMGVSLTRLRSPTVPLPIGAPATNNWTKPVAKSSSEGFIADQPAHISVSMASGMALASMRQRSSSAGDLLRVSPAGHAASIAHSPAGSFFDLQQLSGLNANVLSAAPNFNTQDVWRPTLVKSASASVLGPSTHRTPASQRQYRKAPTHIQTHIATPHGSRPTIVVDESMPPTPSSMASTEIDEEDEYGQDDDEEDYGVETNDRERIHREMEHEDRWARVRMDADVEVRSRQQPELAEIPRSPPLPSTLSSIAKKTENVLGMLASSHAHATIQSPTVASPTSGNVSVDEQRRRLKSMSSLGNLHPSVSTSPPASASTTNFALPLPSSKSNGKGRVFRGFVERMGLVGTSNSNSNNPSMNNSPASSYPNTPMSPAPLSLSILGTSTNSSADVLYAFPSPPATAGFTRSPSHSPTTSLSLGGGQREGASVFATGGLLGKKQPKRKLVISGVALADIKGYEAVKSWCESFGTIREMTRAENGCLYVDFEKASVAETVCRLQAQVFIKGAGSVSLSWYTKKKPL